jgi:hypothetical protein
MQKICVKDFMLVLCLFFIGLFAACAKPEKPITGVYQDDLVGDSGDGKVYDLRSDGSCVYTPYFVRGGIKEYGPPRPWLVWVAEGNSVTVKMPVPFSAVYGCDIPGFVNYKDQGIQSFHRDGSALIGDDNGVRYSKIH